MSSSTVIPKPQVHVGTDLTRFGTNPFGEPLYRVVFAPSVRHLIGGRWRDGSVEYRSRPSYGTVGNEWILERWISGEEYCRMSRADYEIRFRNESGLLTMGPYPVNGTYVMCMDAPIRAEAIPSIGKIVDGIEFGRRNQSHERMVENGQLIAADFARTEKSKDDVMLGRIQELRPAFGNRPTSFRGGVHSTKSKVIMDRSAPINMTPGSFKVLKEKENA